MAVVDLQGNELRKYGLMAFAEGKEAVDRIGHHGFSTPASEVFSGANAAVGSV
jgi:hypothetical protein